MRKCNPDVYNNIYLLIKILIIVESITRRYNNKQEHKIHCKKRRDVSQKNNTKKIKNKKKEKISKDIISKENDKKTNLKENNTKEEKKSNKDEDAKNKDIKDKYIKDKHIKDIDIKESKLNKDKKANKKSILTKIPIVISRKKLGIPIETVVDLKEEALEVKGISNRVFLKEAVFVPIKNDKRNKKTRKGKLFLKGFVRNCIEYLSFEYCDDERIKGGIKYCINYIPFKCSTMMECVVLPKIYSKEEFQNNILKIPDKIKEKKNTYRHKYEEKINCEITEIKILGTRECKNSKALNDTFFLEKTFSNVEQKMMIELSLLLTQNHIVQMKK